MTTINIGKGIEINVDFETMPANAIEHCATRGLKEILSDANANATEKEYPVESERIEAARAMSMKKLDALMRGEVRVAGARGPRGDEVMRVAMGLVPVPKGTFTAESIAAYKKQYLERNPELVEQARLTVEKKKTIAVDDDMLALLTPKPAKAAPATTA